MIIEIDSKLTHLIEIRMIKQVYDVIFYKSKVI